MRARFSNGRYDAAFATNDRMALGAILYLRQPFRELGVTAMETLNLLLTGAPVCSRSAHPCT